MLATAADDVRVWNADTFQLLHHFYADSSARAATVSWSFDDILDSRLPKAASTVHLTAFTDRGVHHTKANIGHSCASAQFSRRSGRLLAVGCCDGSVLLWDIKQERPLGSFKARSAAVTRLSFGNDDSFLAVATADGALCVYNMATKCFSKSLTQPTDQVVTGLRCSALRRYQVASSWTDGTVRMWDGGSQRLVAEMLLHPNYSCSGVSLSPQLESLLATVGMDRRLVFFDLTSRRLQGSVQCPETLETVDFAGDGRRAVVGGTSGKVYVYDLRNTEAPLVETLAGHVGPVGCIQCCQTGASWRGASSQQTVATPAVILTEVPPEMSCLDASPQDHCMTKANNGVGRVSDRGDFLEDSSLSVSSPDFFGLSERSSGHRRNFRLSDVMPVLSDSMMSSSSPLTPSGAQNDSVFEKGPEIHQQQETSHASDAAQSPPEAPQPSHEENRVPYDGPRHAEVGAALETLRGEMDDGFLNIRRHLTHSETYAAREHLAFRREVQGMLQQIFDEVLAIRRNLEEMRLDS
ncbi:unnamed protein product [Ixodes hexagonus]